MVLLDIRASTNVCLHDKRIPGSILLIAALRSSLNSKMACKSLGSRSLHRVRMEYQWRQVVWTTDDVSSKEIKEQRSSSRRPLSRAARRSKRPRRGRNLRAGDEGGHEFRAAGQSRVRRQESPRGRSGGIDERSREQRIQDEQVLLVSVEEDVLAAELQPLGLSLKEIKPDGHCLYRAVEDQLQLHPSAPQYSFQELRKIAAGYIREHPEDFVPFIGGDVELEDYCREIESTAAWGGQLELEALSHALQKHIFVF
ncbi:hypothetical protein SELMODRAFT_422010 [Selaginella moellendorffii]|uniref:OTU domain-containing protein n=1 Tax=Selaginella moellendorffii TaxID=88036 RepID=D8SH21_SELML|nr:hypothetical protein SELMODRAFT_422010 [Selaginella moellendorffii]